MSAATARERRISTWPAIALTAIPGLGHLYLRRHAQGVAFFGLFAAALDGVLLGALWQGEDAALVGLVSRIAAVAIWIGGLASVLRLTVFTDRERLARRRDEKVREGMVHYLRGELDPARRAFEDAAACDVDRHDFDVLFHLGAVAARAGDRRRARRLFRRCLAWDPGGKWRAEIERLEKAAAAGPATKEHARK